MNRWLTVLVDSLAQGLGWGSGVLIALAAFAALGGNIGACL